MRFANRILASVFLPISTLLLMLLAPIAEAQTYAAPTPPVPQYAPGQLDQMLAPIALYPDPLLGQILIAATYPLEVVQADRWLQDPRNASLQGGPLAEALQQQPWDPSVKSLIPFPQVLRMMDSNLGWTEQLGDAFLAQQAAIMDSVQRLRRNAQAAGTLASTPQQVVTAEAQTIVIEPASPEVVYVPVYNPMVIYGSWPYPAYPPYFFPVPGIEIGLGIGFGIGIGIFAPYWGWDHWDWHHHQIDIDSGRFNPINGGHPPVSSGPWEHDPGHRHRVPYHDAATQARFQGGTEQVRSNFRGYDRAPSGAPPAHQTARSNPMLREPSAAAHAPAPSPVRMRAPAPMPVQRPSVPAFESYGRGSEVRTQEQRGASSRTSMPAGNMHSGPSVRGQGKSR